VSGEVEVRGVSNGVCRMRTVSVLTIAAALAGLSTLVAPARAAERCDTNCVGPACSTDCVREPNATVGRDGRRDVIIEERTRREPGVVIEKERDRSPGVDVEIKR
jgi:hypothetical protein